MDFEKLWMMESKGWNFEPQCHTEMGTAITMSRCGGNSVEQNEGFKGIMGHGCSVCEGQTYIDWWLKSLENGNAIVS